VDVLGVGDAQAERVANLAGGAERGVDWVNEALVEGVWLVGSVWRRLPVWCLGLDVSGKDVLCAGELVLVEGVMFYSATV
jgi:hypothetical protein